jgi:tetratricopeptide (TPR) repeat protein
MTSAASLDQIGTDAADLTKRLDRAQALAQEAPSEAEEIARQALNHADARGLDNESARAHYLLARLNVVRGELQTALHLIDEARTRWLRIGDHLSALRTDLGRMQVLDDLGRHADAAAVGARLLAALSEYGGNEPDVAWLRAAALENYGVACSYVGDHELAVDAYENAEATYASLGREAERARPMANRGVELLGLGRAREALEVFTAAAATFEQCGDRLWAAKCRGDLARAYRQLGDYTEALRVLAQERSTLEELGATAEVARVQLAVATTYLAIGMYDAAVAEAAAASRLTRAAGMDHDTAGAEFALALASVGLGAHASAWEALAQAAALFEQVGDLRSRTEARLVEAELLAAGGDLTQAATTAMRAVEECRAGDWPALLARSLLCVIDVGDPAHATAALAQAEPVIAELALPVLSHELDLRRARHAIAAGRPDEGEALLRRAVDAVQQLGGTLPDHMLRRAFRARAGTAHDELIGLLITRGAPGDHDEAARLADASKSQTLHEWPSGRPLRVNDHDEAIAELHADLNATYVAMAEAAHAVQHRRLHERATELQQRITALRLQAVATASHPGRYSVGPATAGESCALATLAFHIIGDDVYAFVSGAGGLDVRRVADVRSVDRQLELLAAQWGRFQVGNGFARRHEQMLLDTAIDALSQLHELLIAPVADLLTAVEEELRIVPHRQLCNVPFHALYDDGRPLIDRWTISVAPTRDPLPGVPATAVLSDAIVLAVPDARAPAMAEEAEAVAAALPSADLLVGQAASSDALMASAPAGKILHLACHGLFRSSNPLFSALRLADRWVTAAELAELDLSQALVVLSACESGRQDNCAEPVGLAWALLAAGASGVIVSHWVVDDETTSRAMADMYRHLSAGLTPAAALREAQRAAAARTPHPFHWAPFSYVTVNRGPQ